MIFRRLVGTVLSHLSDSHGLVVLIAVSLALSACSEIDSLTRNLFADEVPTAEHAADGDQPENGTAEASGPYEAWRVTPFVYRLQAGDEIRVKHPYAQELDQDVTILPDGRIYLPLVGSVVAEDMSPERLSRELENAYSADLRNPDIAVIPTRIGSQKVYVGGEVKKPGMYSFDGPFGVIEALFTAGGLENSANGEKIVILRRTPDDRAMMRTVDISDLFDEKTPRQNIRLRQYDIVFVPRTTAAEVGVWVEQNITNILPFSRSFSYSYSRELGN